MKKGSMLIILVGCVSVLSAMEVSKVDDQALQDQLKIGFRAKALIEEHVLGFKRMIDSLESINQFYTFYSSMDILDENTELEHSTDRPWPSQFLADYSETLGSLADTLLGFTPVQREPSPEKLFNWFECWDLISHGLSRFEYFCLKISVIGKLVQESEINKSELYDVRATISKGFQEVLLSLQQLRAFKVIGVKNVAQEVETVLKSLKKNTEEVRETLNGVRDTQRELELCLQKLQMYFVKFSTKKAEINHLYNMLDVTDMSLRDYAKRAQMTKERKKKMAALCVLPEGIEKEIATLFPILKKYRAKDILTDDLKEHYRVRYYKALEDYIEKIDERSFDDKKQRINELSERLDSCNEKFGEIKEGLIEQVPTLIKQIQVLRGTLDKARAPYKQEKDLQIAFECIQALEVLSAQNHYVQPMITLLESSEKMVSPWIDGLMSDDMDLVRLAAEALLEQFGFLSGTSITYRALL